MSVFYNFENSYTTKLGFYGFVLLLPALLMTLVEFIAAGSFVSISSENSSRFLMFLLYFLPGIYMARSVTDSWRRTIGVMIAYMLISPAYYLYASLWACKFGGICIEI